MEMISAFIPLLTIAIGIGLPALLLIHLFNKKSILLKIPSLKIWKTIIKTIGRPPKRKINLFNFNFLVQLILLCLLAYLCSSPVILQENKSRSTFNILINRSTSMATKSEMYSSRWERLKKTLYNQLLEIGLNSEDRIILYFNPPFNSMHREISLAQIDKIINETAIVDLPPTDISFYQMAKSDNQNIYVTDSIVEIPESLKEKFNIIYIQDNEHINVGWIEFWVDNQTVNGVLKNFSNYSLNVNIDLKVNGISIQANDFAPAIKPNESFLFRKVIQEDFNNINLIELSVACPGDALEADNLISLSRLKSQKLKVLITPDISSCIIKLIRAMSDNVEVIQGDVVNQALDNQIDLIISCNYYPQSNSNQILVNPLEGNAFFQVLNQNVNSSANATQWLNSNEQMLLEKGIFENIREIKENLLSVKILTETRNGWPIIARWKNNNSSIYLFNFDCSEKSTLTNTPIFPFLVAKVIDEMNFNKFNYFRTGDLIEEYNITSKRIKVFQPNRKEIGASIDFNNSDVILLKNAGIYANENVNICVNLLNEKESNIKQTDILPRMNISVAGKNKELPFDLRPYIAGIILFLLAFEWMHSTRERQRLSSGN